MSARSTGADKYGWKRGLGAYSKDELWGGKTNGSDDGPVVNKKHDYLLDDERDQPSGKMLGGGGDVSDNKRGGAAPPRYRPKAGGPIGNFNKKPK